ncbi:MAG: YgjP-like metallopeptidase domain-containing protein, partial [Saccharofermentanales bacterium]
MNHNYTIIRSRRKTISLVVKHDGTLEVRAPLRYSARLLDDFVNQKSDWICKAQTKTSNAIVFRDYTTEEYEKIKAITLI